MFWLRLRKASPRRALLLLAFRLLALECVREKNGNKRKTCTRPCRGERKLGGESANEKRTVLTTCRKIVKWGGGVVVRRWSAFVVTFLPTSGEERETRKFNSEMISHERGWKKMWAFRCCQISLWSKIRWQNNTRTCQTEDALDCMLLGVYFCLSSSLRGAFCLPFFPFFCFYIYRLMALCTSLGKEHHLNTEANV